MKPVHCPHCKKLLFKAKLANIEVLCKCGRLVKVNFVTSEGLLQASLINYKTHEAKEKSTDNK